MNDDDADLNGSDPECLDPIAEAASLLAVVEDENGEPTERWHSPDVSAMLERLLHLLDVDSLAEESSERGFLSRLNRARARLRDRLESSARRATGLLERLAEPRRELAARSREDDAEDPDESAGQVGPWTARLESSRRVWQALHRALADDSSYALELEQEAARRWRDASAVTGFWNHVRRCLAFSVGSLLLAYLVYAAAFLWPASGHLPPEAGLAAHLAVVLDAFVWALTDSGSLALGALVIFASSVVLYRLGAVALVKVRTREFAASVGALRGFLEVPAKLEGQAFPTPPGVQRSIQLTRRGTRIKWLPLLASVMRLRGAAWGIGLYLLALLVVPSILGAWRDSLTVLRDEAGICRPNHGLLLAEDRERVVLLLAEVPPKAGRWAAHATLVVPRREIWAMARGLDLDCGKDTRLAGSTNIVWPRQAEDAANVPNVNFHVDLGALDAALRAIAVELRDLGPRGVGGDETVRRLEVRLEAVASRLEDLREIDLSEETIRSLRPDLAQIDLQLAAIAEELGHQSAGAQQIARALTRRLCLEEAEVARHAVKNFMGSGRAGYLQKLLEKCPDLDLTPFVSAPPGGTQTAAAGRGNGAAGGPDADASSSREGESLNR